MLGRGDPRSPTKHGWAVGRKWEHPKGPRGEGSPPLGRKKLHWPKEWEGKGKIYAQAKISSKREKEREELMEPEETVAALKRRERVRSKKKREEDCLHTIDGLPKNLCSVRNII
jgi:hypothetical protein